MIWTKIKIFYRFYGKIQNDFRRENPKKIREFEKDISNWKKLQKYLETIGHNRTNLDQRKNWKIKKRGQNG